MPKSKTREILASLKPRGKSVSKAEKDDRTPSIMISWTNPLQLKASMDMVCQMKELVSAVTNAWIDVVPETLYVDLPTQIVQTPENGVTKDTNTGNVVIKDSSWDYVVITWAPWASRYSQVFTPVANVATVITHNLWTEDVVIMVKDNVTKKVVNVDIEIIDADNIEITSTTTDVLRVTCI